MAPHGPLRSLCTMKRRTPLLPAARTDRGFMLVGVALLLLVLSIVSVGAARKQLDAARAATGHSIGQGLSRVNKALDTYMAKYGGRLASGLSIAGVVDPYSPTVAELRALGVIVEAVNEVPAQGGRYVTRVMRLPAGCAPDDCNLASQVWLRDPILDPESGRVDSRKLGAAIASLGGDGGFSTIGNPGTIRFGNGWSIANPDAGARPGIVVAVAGYGSSAWGAFVRINDTRDPDLRGDLTVAGDVSGNTVTSNTFVSNGDLIMNGAAAQNTSCSTPFATRRNSTTNAGHVICYGGLWLPIGTAVANVAQGTPCGVAGQTATNGANQEFICKNGFYVSILSLLPKNVEIARYVVGDNNVSVPKPACASGGSPSFSFEARTIGADFSQAPPFTAVRYSADDYGWAWVPRILLVNMNGALQSGNVLGLQGVFKAECFYP